MAENNAVKHLIDSYQSESPIQGDANKGQQLWNKKFTGKKPFTERSCQTCHNSNLKQSGQHIRTKKVIKPMAPSVNSESLSKVKKIKKWLKRNCKWTIGRECSAEEKIHLLTFLNQL
ncbi:MAG: DUF1924 domain-containing protein [Gammaproteobacteria bacterium]|nr:DUF1924 domain-containing protein [Gammaproteobacteria bacterium]